MGSLPLLPLFLIVALCSVSYSASSHIDHTQSRSSSEGTPIKRSTTALVNVLYLGAVGDGITDDTDALRSAIRLQTGTKVLHLPAGYTFLSQPLNLTSSITLQIDGVLKAMLPDCNFAWPRLPPLPSYNTSDDANHFLQYQSFIYASNAHDIVITGSGTIDGNGPWWWDQFTNHSLSAGRPNLMQFVNSTGIEISGVSLRDAAFWTLHPVYCKYVYIHHIWIRSKTYAPNVDGIDPDSCQHVMMEYNDIGCGDDHFAIKAGRCGGGAPFVSCKDWNSDGRFKTFNLTIRHNLLRNGMGIAIGSESSGDIQGVYIYNNTIGICKPGGECDDCCGWSPAMHLKTTLTRGGTISDISFHDNVIVNTSSALLLELDYQNHNHDIPPNYPAVQVRNISFLRNRIVGTARGVVLGCSVNDPCHSVVLEDNDFGPMTNYACNYIQSYREMNNRPVGLEKCLRESMNGTSQARGGLSSSS